MKHRAASIILILTAALALTGCGNGQPSSADATETNAPSTSIPSSTSTTDADRIPQGDLKAGTFTVGNKADLVAYAYTVTVPHGSSTLSVTRDGTALFVQKIHDAYSTGDGVSEVRAAVQDGDTITIQGDALSFKGVGGRGQTTDTSKAQQSADIVPGLWTIGLDLPSKKWNLTTASDGTGTVSVYKQDGTQSETHSLSKTLPVTLTYLPQSGETLVVSGLGTIHVANY